MMRYVMLSLLLCGACNDADDVADPANVVVGVESPDGIEPFDTADELNLYLGFAGGHMGYLWLGDGLPEHCLEYDSDCVASATMAVLDETVVDWRVSIVPPQSSVEGWEARIPMQVDLNRLDNGPDTAWGQTAQLRLTVTIDGNTASFETDLILVDDDSLP